MKYIHASAYHTVKDISFTALMQQHTK